MSYFDTLQSIKTVITYLRVSTERQVEKFSLPAQDKLTRELAAKHGWEIYKVYRDEGYSGSWIEKRPAFSALLEDVARQRFDAVVVTDFDRLTRPDNLKDLGRIQEVFIQHNVKIVTLSDMIDLSDDDQWFLSSLLGIVGAKEKKKLIARMKRGIQAKKEAGEFYGGIPPSGYRWDGQGRLALRETTETYSGKQVKYTCYDWRTVQELFELYLYQEASLREICQRYKIYFQTLADILDRAWFYAGYILETRGRAERVKRGKKEPRERLAQGLHPSIITPEEAKRVLAKRKAVKVAHTRTRLKFPCAGLLHCGECGRSMYVYRSLKRPKHRPWRLYYYYVCQGRHGTQKWIAQKRGVELQPCSMPFVRAELVEKTAWGALERFLVSPEVVLEQVGSAGHQITLLEKELHGIEQEGAELAKRQSNLIDLYEHGGFNLKELDSRMGRVKTAQVALERRQRECQERIGHYQQQQVDPDQVYRVLGQIEEIIRFATPEHRREIFRILFCEMTAKRDGILEISATMPTEGVVQRLSVALTPPGGPGAGVYQNALQEGALLGRVAGVP